MKKLRFNVAVTIDAVALAHGCNSFHDIERNERHRVFSATRGGKKVLIKATAVRTEMENLRNEAEVHKFLRKITPRGANFTFPETEILADDEVCLICMPFVHKGWYAQKSPYRLLRRITDCDLEDMFQAILFLHRIRHDQLPAALRGKGRKYTAKDRFEQQESYFRPAIGTLVTRAEVSKLQRLMREVGYKRRFVHHDILPLNMARLPDGKLLITDAEYARWEMKWYDVAYTYLQLHCLYGDNVLARLFLRYIVRRFKEELPDEDIEKEIFFPLGYWIAASMFIAMKDPKQRKRVRKTFELILKRDLNVLIGG
ncbi:hypothetical protein KKF59_02030 [Patescibacteria group bacterium]|nr:hypothetical protein [Patescibacteria group bacterium]MBU1034838.1 hypothetical protein [Patescibacteria group bacterium]MBU1629600.1 hypothetical protein [Patescibacteria group bacterium]MBU1907888.1 hypothetical protein [Patescibacteria group bacterium]